MFSHGSLNCLITEKSVLMKLGPLSGAAVGHCPSSPGAAEAKSARIKPVLDVVDACWSHATGIAGNWPAFIWISNDVGSNQLDPLAWKFTPEVKLALSTTNTAET